MTMQQQQQPDFNSLKKDFHFFLISFLNKQKQIKKNQRKGKKKPPLPAANVGDLKNQKRRW